MVKKAIWMAIVFCALSTATQACGYYGCGYNAQSFLFGRAFGQLSPYDQANFGWYDGSNLVNLRNYYYDQWFGINSVPGGFPAILSAFDNNLLAITRSAEPRNYYPPVFRQMTSLGPCIPGFTVGC